MASDETRRPDAFGDADVTRSRASGHARVPVEAPLPAEICGYRVLRLLGEGGMGVVYEAEQPNPRRLVALKVIRVGYLSAEHLRRFEREAEVLGRLHHPAIAQVYEAGTAEMAQGRQPFFAMELIRGQALTAYVAARQLTISQRLELLIKICEAVQYAHQQGIIHRDLKPGNILVDESGQPKILDFGIAKMTGSEVQAATMQTDIGQLVGTLPYMSPEQAGGDPHQLDTRSDVYALGVIAYELMAGKLPYDLQRKMLAEAVRVIQEEEPTRLSIHDRHLRGDLETIVGKALEKDKTRRYQSASEFANDIKRYLSDEPIVARPPSVGYQLRKFAKRNKVLVAAAATVVLALVLGVIGTTLGMVQARQQRALAVQASMEADAQRQVAQEKSIHLAAEVDAHRRTIYFQRIQLADSLYRDANISVMQQTLALCPPELRNWEWHRLCYVHDRSLATHARQWEIFSTDWSPDGRRIAVTWGNSLGEICDAATGQPLYKLDGYTAGPLYHIVYSPDGKHLATASADGAIRLWDAATGKEEYAMPLSKSPKRVAFSPDGGRLAFSGSGPPTLGVMDLRTCDSKFFASSGFGTPLSLAWRPDGKAIVFAYDTCRLRLLDADSGAEIWGVTTRPRKIGVGSIDFSPDGKRLVVAYYDGSLGIYDAANGSELSVLRGHTSAVRNARYSPDGKFIASGSEDRTVRIWDAATGEERAILRGHVAYVSGIAWSPDGKRLATAGGTALKIWDPDAAAPWRQLGAAAQTINLMTCTADGKYVAVANSPGVIGWVDLATGTQQKSLRGFGHLSAMSLAADGKYLVSMTVTGALRFWDVEQQKVLWTVPDAAPMENNRFAVAPVLLSPDGKRVFSGCWQQVLRAWNAQTGQLEAPYPAEFLQGKANAMALSPDGKLLAVAAAGPIGVFDTQRGALLWSLPDMRRSNPISSLAFSPDGKILAAGGHDGQTVLHDSRTGLVLGNLREKVRQSLSNASMIECLAWSPDGSRLVSAGYDGELRLWDTATGDLALVLRGHQKRINAVAFSPDGKKIISGSDDGTLRLWDSGTWDEALPSSP